MAGFGWWLPLSSELLPDRERQLELAETIGTNAAVLAFGFAIGVLWVGTSVQATGCVTQAGLTGACEILPVVEQAAKYALLVVAVGFVVAFAAVYSAEEGDSGTSGVSNTDVTDN